MPICLACRSSSAQALLLAVFTVIMLTFCFQQSATADTFNVLSGLDLEELSLIEVTNSEDSSSEFYAAIVACEQLKTRCDRLVLRFARRALRSTKHSSGDETAYADSRQRLGRRLNSWIEACNHFSNSLGD